MSKTEAVICLTVGGTIYSAVKWRLGFGFDFDGLLVGAVFFTAGMLLIHLGLVKP